MSDRFYSLLFGVMLTVRIYVSDACGERHPSSRARWHGLREDIDINPCNVAVNCLIVVRAVL